MLCYVMLCYVMLCYVMLCYVMCCAVLCKLSFDQMNKRSQLIIYKSFLSSTASVYSHNNPSLLQLLVPPTFFSLTLAVTAAGMKFGGISQRRQRCKPITALDRTQHFAYLESNPYFKDFKIETLV